MHQNDPQVGSQSSAGGKKIHTVGQCTQWEAITLLTIVIWHAEIAASSHDSGGDGITKNFGVTNNFHERSQVILGRNMDIPFICAKKNKEGGG